MIALLLSELTLSPAVSLSPEARSFLSVLIRSEPAHGRAQPTGFDQLTRKERKVFSMLLDRDSNDGIATRLNASRTTVKMSAVPRRSQISGIA
jgi:DNA-binding NarL/FixJ family response regulator